MPADSAARQRLFVAIPCPLTSNIQHALDELRAAQRDAASGLRVVDAATLHITLSFLGSVTVDRITQLQAALDNLHTLPAPQLVLEGVGHFSSALWLGVAPNPALAKLAARCDASLRALGFELEERPFHPHVTLARLNPRPGFDCKAWCRTHRDTRWVEFAADRVLLYRSETFPEGARYSVIHTVTLR